MTLFTLGEAARLVGTTYSRVWHVFALHRLPQPLRLGRIHMLTESDIEALKKYFSSPPAGARPTPRTTTSD